MSLLFIACQALQFLFDLLENILSGQLLRHLRRGVICKIRKLILRNRINSLFNFPIRIGNKVLESGITPNRIYGDQAAKQLCNLRESNPGLARGRGKLYH